MNVLNFLVGLNSVILISLVVNVFKPFIGSYAAKKGENLATKEDIAQLTNIAEGIKAEISDEIWDRQRQWEMRRDAALDSVREMKELEHELLRLRSAYLTIHNFSSPGAMDQRKNAVSGFIESSLKFYRSIFVSELSIGVDFGNTLLAYFDAIVSIAAEFEKGNPEFCSSDKFREILGLSEKVLEVARKKLDIKNTAGRVV